MSDTAEIHADKYLSGELITDPNSAKGKLLKQARSLFRQKGYEKTTAKDIAQATGILSGSVFHHFASKQDILRCVMEETICYTLAYLKAELEKAETIEQQIQTLIRSELQGIHSREGHDFTVLVTEWRSLEPHNQQSVLQYRKAYEGLWLKILGKGKAAGLCDQEGLLLRSFIRGALIDTINWYREDGSLSLDALTQEVYKTFFH